MLAQLPADREWVIAAGADALATPALARALDVVRGRVAPSLGCVLDAARGADAVAVAVDHANAPTIAIATPARLASCPALSQIGPELWLASSVPVSAPSVLVDPRWQRARPALVAAPIAVAGDLDDHRVVGALVVEPRRGWLAIDAPGEAVANRELRAFVGDGSAAVTRHGGQLVADLSALEPAELVRSRLAVRDAVPVTRPTPAPVHCDAAPVITRCDGRTVRVVSVRAAAAQLVAGELAAVVENGEVRGVRLGGDALVLARGDVVVALDGRPVTSAAAARALAARASSPLTVVVRRGTVAAMFELSE